MPTAVLIVNYRTYDELQQCVSSLSGYLQPGDEVIVVDYESDKQALASAVNGAAGVRTVTFPVNLGFAAGINLAARNSTAPFLLLLNPDAIVEGPVVKILEDWLNDHPDVGVAAPRVLNADGTVQATARRFPDATTAFGGRSTPLTKFFPNNWLTRRNLLAREAQDPCDVDWLSGACLMTRRDLFERMGGFDESFFLYWEDADYCRRVADAGFRRTYVPKVSVRHAGGRSADRDPVPAIRAFHKSAFRLYWKHASLLSRLAAPLVAAGLWMRGEQRASQARRARNRQ